MSGVSHRKQPCLTVAWTAAFWVCSSVPVSKALQEFDLALRGKKKREKFLKNSKRKKELTVSLTLSWPVVVLPGWRLCLSLFLLTKFVWNRTIPHSVAFSAWGEGSVWDPEGSDVCWAGCQERETPKKSQSYGGGGGAKCRSEMLQQNLESSSTIARISILMDVKCFCRYSSKAKSQGRRKKVGIWSRVNQHKQEVSAELQSGVRLFICTNICL